jgi:23S rRNA pseudouridine1911/1915/1917 synthase
MGNETATGTVCDGDEAEPAVIHEDNQIFVVIKSQNIPSVPDGSGDISLQEQLKRTPKSFVGAVHRLDRVTGGVMVFAKTSKAAARLSEQIKNGIFQKMYLAIVRGVPERRSATLVNYLAKNSDRNIVSVVPQATTGAKRAEMTYTVMESKNGISLISVKLDTGRAHQIRVQMKHIGCPVYGDWRYGGANGTKGNIALWAYDLKFVHPTMGDELNFIVNPPEDGVWQNFEFDRKMRLFRGKR